MSYQDWWLKLQTYKDKGRASCNPYSSAIDRRSDRFFAISGFREHQYVTGLSRHGNSFDSQHQNSVQAWLTLKWYCHEQNSWRRLRRRHCISFTQKAGNRGNRGKVEHWKAFVLEQQQLSLPNRWGRDLWIRCSLLSERTHKKGPQQ